MSHLSSRRLMTLTMALHPTIDLGRTPAGTRRIFAVESGAFEGERLRGSVSPLIGSDLLLERADGTRRQDVRVLLETDDGAHILMTYQGVRRPAPEVDERLARGETVAPDAYYLRTAAFFETADDRYAWLNGIVTVGVGSRSPNGVRYDLFEVL